VPVSVARENADLESGSKILLWRFARRRLIHEVAAQAASIWNFAAERPLLPVFNQETTIMDWNRVEGNWKQVKGKVKEQWGKLTDDDLDRIAGKRDQLEGKIQERYGLEKDRVRRDIDDWYSRQGW